MFPIDPIDNEIWVSSSVAAVCRVLSMEPPMVPTASSENETERKLLSLTRSLTTEQQKMLIPIVESLLKSGGNS